MNSEYIFKSVLYLVAKDRYYNSLLNMGYSPLTFGNTETFKYSNELYTIIINSLISKIGDISNSTIVEMPCMNVNSGIHILSQVTIKKLICVTPHNDFIKLLEPYIKNNKKLEYRLGNYSNFNRLNIDKKEIDVIISIEPSRHNYCLTKLSNHLKNIIQPNKYWVIADIIDNSQMNNINQHFIKNKFKILKTVDISSNIINSINVQNTKKEQSLPTSHIVKEMMTNLVVTKNSKIYKKLVNKQSKYLIIILSV
jgi:hypothetical protein